MKIKFWTVTGIILCVMVYYMYYFYYYMDNQARKSEPYIPAEWRWQTIYLDTQDTVYYIRWGNRVYMRSSNSIDTITLIP